MTDKNAAADALVASLREKRKRRQDILRARSRERTPDRGAVDGAEKANERGDTHIRDDTPEEVNDTEQAPKSETSLIEDGGGWAEGGKVDYEYNDERVSLPTLTDDEISKRVEESSSATILPLPSGASTVRERMRQKMLARRERPTTTTDAEASEKEASKSLSMTSRRLRGLRDAKTISRTRFDGAESKDNEELEQELAARSVFICDWRSFMGITQRGES